MPLENLLECSKTCRLSCSSDSVQTIVLSYVLSVKKNVNTSERTIAMKHRKTQQKQKLTQKTQAEIWHEELLQVLPPDIDPAQPTSYPPGSIEKMALIALRYLRGLPVNHPLDIIYPVNERSHIDLEVRVREKLRQLGKTPLLDL